MSCHAGAHATDCPDNWSDPSELVLLIPALKASIAIAGLAITRNLAWPLCQAASSPALQQCTVSKNGWNHWIFHSKALGTLERTQEALVAKQAHNLPLTRRHMKRTARAWPDLCPSCLETIETTPRIFTCERHLQRWQATFLDSLRKLLAMLRTQQDLQMILMVGIQGAAQDDPLFDMPTDNREGSKLCASRFFSE